MSPLLNIIRQINPILDVPRFLAMPDELLNDDRLPPCNVHAPIIQPLASILIDDDDPASPAQPARS